MGPYTLHDEIKGTYVTIRVVHYIHYSYIFILYKNQGAIINKVAVMSSTVHVIPNGTLEVLADGTKIQKTDDGVVLCVRPDGTKTQTSADGARLVVYADGSKVQSTSDGTRQEVSTDGTITQVS